MANVFPHLEYAGLLSVQVVFALYQLFTKMLLISGYDPVAFAFVRVALAAVLMSCLLIIFVPKERRWPRAEHRHSFYLIGVGMCANILGLVMALQLTSSTAVATIQVLRPVFTGFLNWMKGLESMTTTKCCALCLCTLGGVILTAADQRVGVNPWGILGCCCVMVHCAGFATLITEQKVLVSAGYDSFMITTHAYVFTTGFCGLALAIQARTHLHIGKLWDLSDLYLGNLVYSVVFATAYSYVIMAWATKRVSPTLIMLFMLLQGIMTVAASRFLFHDIISTVHIAGAMLILVGLFAYVDFSGQSSHIPVSSKKEDGTEDERCSLLSKPDSVNDDVRNKMAVPEDTANADERSQPTFRV